MALTQRAGYLHALEGVIAALIVALYLTSIVTVPEPADWSEVHVSKRSEDLLAAMDETGMLDRTVVRDDVDSFNAFVDSMDNSIRYDVTVDGLPQSYIEVAVIANESDTISTTSTASPPPSGAPDSPSYRTGTVSGNVDFVLTDTANTSIRKYDTVNFDFDGNSSFDDPGEGPYHIGDRFTCQDRCSGTYEVDPFNTTLNLSDASFTQRLANRINKTTVGGRTVTLDMETVRLDWEDLNRFDAAIVHDWSVSEIEQERDRFDAFLEDDKFLTIITDVQNDQVDSNYLGDLGFSYVEEYALTGSGPETNLLYTIHGAGNGSYLLNNRYLQSTIDTYTFTDQGTHYTGNMTVRGDTVTVNVSQNGQRVSFGNEGFAVEYTAGDTVHLKGNTYHVRSVKPLRLEPLRQQRFDSFDTERIDADHHATRMANYQYNTTLYDVSENYSSEITDPANIPAGVIDNATNPCNIDNHSYKEGSFTIPETGSYTFLMVNFNVETPCNNYYEYVYVDRDGDGDYDENGDGIYQHSDTITLGDHDFEVIPHPDGNGTTLRKIGPRIVGEVPVVDGAVSGGGRAALIGRTTLGDDDLALLRTLIVSETDDSTRLTEESPIGDESYGYRYTSDTGRGMLETYTLNTVWWFN